jgi:uncharacterized protein YprB with RNaseH-like and TPR domain
MKYGRAMSKDEWKRLKKTKILSDHGNGLVPVFDNPEYIEEKLKKMSKDKLENYFRTIGVRNCDVIVFFDIETDGLKIVGPVPQTNGLREYKIPEGAQIKEIYKVIKL